MKSDTESKPLLDDQPEEQKKDNIQVVTSGTYIDIVVRVVLIILFVVGLEAGSLVKNQYVYKWIEENSNSSINSLNSTIKNSTLSSDPCGGDISAGSEKKNQSAASIWLMYFSCVEHILAIPMLLFYGSYSDFIGRKPLMMIACGGFCIQYCLKAFIVYENYPLIYFLIPYGIAGITGGSYTFYLAMLASVADKTKHGKKRALGIAVVEALIGVGVSSAQIGTGYFIKDLGYMYPLVAVAGVFGTCLLLIPFGVTDTRSTRSTKHVKFFDYLRNIFGMFVRKSEILTNSVFIFNMTMLTFFLLYMGASDSTIDTLYQLRSPFCWDSRKIGWYGFGTDIVQYVFSLFLVRYLQMCLSDGTIVLTLISAVATSIITGLANRSLMLYISSGAGVLSIMAKPLLRAYISNMIRKDNQGAVFGNMYVIENICSLFSHTIFSEIYAQTQSFMAGFVYLIKGGFYLLSLAIFIILLCCRNRNEKTVNIQEKNFV